MRVSLCRTVVASLFLTTGLHGLVPVADATTTSCSPYKTDSTIGLRDALNMDEDHSGYEPTLSIDEGDSAYRYWMAGTTDIVAGTSALANMWKSQHEASTEGDFSQPPFEPFVGDADVFYGDDGNLYWGALANGTQVNGIPGSPREMVIARRALTDGWEDPNQDPSTSTTHYSKIFREPKQPPFWVYLWDRPWFIQNGTNQDGAAIATLHKLPPNEGPKKHDIDFLWYNRTSTYWENVTVLADNDYTGGSPAVDSSGRIFVPLIPKDHNVANDGDLSYVYSSGDPRTPSNWHLMSGPTGDTLWFPRAAVDATDKFYTVDRTDTATRYAFRADITSSTSDWTVCAVGVAGSNGRVWGVSVAAGDQGKLAIAWYGKEGLTGNWQVRMRLVANADTSTPTLYPASDGGYVIDSNVAVGSLDPGEAFKDFLSVDKFPDGHAVIAYNCYAQVSCGSALLANPRVREERCGIDLIGTGDTC